MNKSGKKLLGAAFSGNSGSRATDNALLALRVVFGLMLVIHGAGKIVNFADLAPQFPDPIGLGGAFALTLSMLAETFGGLALAVGFLTRPTCIVLLINMGVAIVSVHKCDILGVGELAFLYFAVFGVLLYVGAGGKSADAEIRRRKPSLL